LSGPGAEDNGLAAENESIQLFVRESQNLLHGVPLDQHLATGTHGCDSRSVALLTAAGTYYTSASIPFRSMTFRSLSEGPLGLFSPISPLLHGGNAGVQKGGEHGLTQAGTSTEGANLSEHD